MVLLKLVLLQARVQAIHLHETGNEIGHYIRYPTTLMTTNIRKSECYQAYFRSLQTKRFSSNSTQGFFSAILHPNKQHKLIKLQCPEKWGQPWHNGSKLDCRLTHYTINPALMVQHDSHQKICHQPRLSPARYSLTVQYYSLTHHSFIIHLFIDPIKLSIPAETFEECMISLLSRFDAS